MRNKNDPAGQRYDAVPIPARSELDPKIDFSWVIVWQVPLERRNQRFQNAIYSRLHRWIGVKRSLGAVECNILEHDFVWLKRIGDCGNVNEVALRINLSLGNDVGTEPCLFGPHLSVAAELAPILNPVTGPHARERTERRDPAYTDIAPEKDPVAVGAD